MKRLTLFLLVFLLLVGCSPQSDVSESSASISSESTTTTASELNETDSIYENKTVLKWAAPDYVFYRMTSSEYGRPQIDLVNQMLDMSGEEYVLELICLDDFPLNPDISKYRSKFYELLTELLGNNKQIDLITVALNYVHDTQENMSLCIDAGYLEPLSSYLVASEGAEMYNSYPQKMWDAMRYDDEIYAISFEEPTGNSLSLYLNRDYVDKYNIDTDSLTGKQLWEMTDIFSEIRQEKGDILLAIGSLVNTNYMKKGDFSSTINLSYETGEAEFFLDNEMHVRYLEALYDISQMGNMIFSEWVSTYSRDQVFAITHVSYTGDEIDFSDSADMPYDLIKIPHASELCLLPKQVGTGICSTSKNKEMAFDAMTKILNDPKYCNLIKLGEEGVEYEVVDGRATVYDNAPLTLNNDFITIPALDQTANCNELLMQEVEQAAPAEFVGFFFDSTSVIEQQHAVIKLVDSFWHGSPNNLFSGYDNFDGFLADLRQRFEAAGVYDIVDEANRQLAQWRGGE